MFFRSLDRVLKQYPKASSYYYVQEEPENMGPWRFAEHHLRKLSKQMVLNAGPIVLWNYCGRKESASPATGFSKRHQNEFEELLNQVFDSSKTPTPLKA